MHANPPPPFPLLASVHVPLVLYMCNFFSFLNNLPHQLLEVDGLDGDWLDGVDPSGKRHSDMERMRFVEDGDIDEDMGPKARAGAAAAAREQREQEGFFETEDTCDDEGGFEGFREQLVDHFSYKKHCAGGVTWKTPPPPVCVDHVAPRFSPKYIPRTTLLPWPLLPSPCTLLF